MDKQLKVIVIEDEAINLLFLKFLLESIGVTVLDEAGDIDTAVEKITRLKPDLILVDIKLNKNSNGIDLVKILQKSYGNIMHIYCTAYADQTILDQCKQTNPIGFLNKPIDEIRLRKLIDSISS